MDWSDTFWTAYGVVFNTAVDITIGTLNSTGSIACIVGGALGTASYFVNATVAVSYAGAAQFTSQIMVRFSLIEANYTYSQAIPFQQDAAFNNELTSYAIDEWISPSNLWKTSLILSGSGMMLRALGATLDQWQQDRRLQNYYKTAAAIHVGTAGVREYACANAASIAASVSYVCLSAALANALINWSHFPGSTQAITYPSHSADYVSGSHYNGPLAFQNLTTDYKISKNATVTLPDLDVVLHLEGVIDAVARANVTYGVGAFFESQSKASPPIVLPALLGASIIGYAAQGFFKQKVREQQIDRELAAERKELYLPNNTLP
ncbi:MAG: hypothetical protein ACRC0B_02945 [Legionella sp.]